MCSTVIDWKARCEDLEMQLKLAKKMENLTANKIEYQEKVLALRGEEISRLKEINVMLHSELKKTALELKAARNTTKQMNIEKQQLENKAKDQVKATEKQVQIIKSDLEKKNKLIKVANAKLDKLKTAWKLDEIRFDIKIDTLREEYDNLRAEYKNYKDNPFKDAVNFPNSFLIEYANYKLQEDTEGGDCDMDDDVFAKELSRRMTCNICYLDVERLRCSGCLNAMCAECHKKVACCTMCKKPKNCFQPIIMQRL